MDTPSTTISLSTRWSTSMHRSMTVTIPGDSELDDLLDAFEALVLGSGYQKQTWIDALETRLDLIMEDCI